MKALHRYIIPCYPVKSIMDIEGGQVWDKYSFKIDGKTYTLEMIENSILRKMGDPSQNKTCYVVENI